MSSRVTVLLCALLLSLGCSRSEPSAGAITGAPRPAAEVQSRAAAQASAATALGTPREKQILFGDLHVHSTFSFDAFLFSLPLFGGEGAAPPADACDFARYCAGLDFFSINDHAEALTPALWQETKESIRECNARANDPANPDLVAFLGWEWTQTSATPASHYGHKNVVFPGTAEDEVPARPISSIATSSYGEQRRPPAFVMRGAAGVARLLGYGPYGDLVDLMAELSASPDCDPAKNTRDLPLDCRESAATPAELFRKLDEWRFPVLVIPHGLAWGIHAPPGARLENQLNAAQHDPDRQRLLEISSGHGNGEEYRGFAEYATGANGERICPEPTADYLPCCWRAGEIMRARCGDLPADECERRVEEAKQLALSAGVSPDQVFPDTKGEDWLDCDQCRDCFKPVMTLRPRETAQYGAALSNFDERGPDGRPLRFRWGFISSTDTHGSKAGTGYKQYDRTVMTDARGFTDAETSARVRGWIGTKQLDPRKAQPAAPSRLFELFDTERKASFLYPGGIVAVHAEGRDRGAIWNALVRREVYGTSGPRILLWFDLKNGPRGDAPMGSEVEMAEEPRFEVRAAGASIQKPGCPEDVLVGLPAERIESLCRGECHHPGDGRVPIDAIEVVRIRPQARPGEDVGPLIEDPWRRFECPPDPTGCRVEFSDPEFASSARDTVYYVRAIQQPTPAINAANLRTEFDEKGEPVRIDPCHGGFGTSPDDDCLAPASERAWSSPIYVDHASSRARTNDAKSEDPEKSRGGTREISPVNQPGPRFLDF